MDYESIVKRILDSRKKIAASNSNISIWDSWYKSVVPSFHKYYIFNGAKKQYRDRLSMHMAKKVSEDWASLLMNEKVKIGVASQQLLDEILMQIDFYNKTNKSVEYGFALSLAGLTIDIEDLLVEDDKVRVSEKTYITLGVYSAKKTIPLTFKNGDCIECAFVREDTEKTKIVVHVLNERDNYDITVLTVDNETGTIEDQFTIESKRKLFALIHPQLVNNLDVDSPYWMSIYGNSIDTLKAIDLVFDSYSNEFNLGRKRIFVASEMDKIDKDTGVITKFFDPNDIVIHQLPPTVAADGSTKPVIQEINGSLRVQEHSQAIQDLLNFLSAQCGLGVDYYRFEKGRVMTATQVISEKSDTFRNLKKHEGVFEKALHTIITGLMYAHNEFTMGKEKFQDIDQVTIQFDDSIIEDKATEKENDRKDVEFGAMSLVAYRMKWFAESEDEALEKIKEVYGDANLLKRLANFTPYLTQGTITPLQFVKMVYIDVKDETEQEALAEEIIKALKTSSDVLDVSNIYNPANE